MKFPSILLFLGTLILLVSQYEVEARNYLLWAFGLEEETTPQGSRQLKAKGNLKTRERIRETRLARREERKRAAEAPSRSSKAVNKRAAGAAGHNKKQKKTASTSRNFLRTKVAQKVVEERKSNLVKVSVKDAGGGKAKKNNIKATTRTIDGGGGGGGEDKKKNGNARQREKEAHFEKKKANHLQKKEKIAEDRAFKEMEQEVGASLIIDVRDADTSAARVEKADMAAAAKNSNGVGRGVVQDRKRNKNDAAPNVGGPEKVTAGGHARVDKPAAVGGGDAAQPEQQKPFGSNGYNSAQHLANQRTYLKKLANHREHQADEVLIALDRTFAKPGRAKPGRIEQRAGRGRGASPEQPDARKGAGGGNGGGGMGGGRGASPEKPAARKKPSGGGGGGPGGMDGGMGGGMAARNAGRNASRKGESGRGRSGAEPQTHRHKRGFNQRKAERIQKQHVRHEARGRTDKVTLEDGRGGGGGRGRGKM